ncbi:OmcA/MtrC family decaheme c-type cytochrome [Shewanella sp. 4_MG-2023]|uniref:OmcA/MtrC family decaheme c-type cytochrome n=1 Tax=Shewanella sp. 4_MG-2023 TaxID=3062652 RepID=UPI0026E1CE47|nr:OmcA/MtrC family decaheme c-type cytochrome [Shewanella sp. 4_MG-2023]MDO6677581.1 OmcA/MtrC family decaheme c-type cytochrome [Shewanella sp. 4_MG-2023]
MMNKFNLNTTAKAVFSAGLLAFALTGCGSDGKDGEDGEDGVVGLTINKAKSLQVDITSTEILDGAISVHFELGDANGTPITDLTTYDNVDSLGMGIAKLVPQSGKGYKTPQWVSYINNVVEPVAEFIPPGFEDKAGTQIQASVETSCKQECLTAGDVVGQYTYTFQVNLNSIDAIEGLDLAYDETLTHRITMELRAEGSADKLVNTHFDFSPITGEQVSPEETRTVNNLEESCLRCHSDNYGHAWAPKLAMHGGKRIALENCQVCHNNYSADPETGASLDFAYMAHKIHKSDYLVAGYNGSVHDYSEVTFPADLYDCQACHIENSDNSPVDAANFKHHTALACGSCHSDSTDPAQIKADMHGKYIETTDCSTCHADEGMAGAAHHFTDAVAKQNAQDSYSATLVASSVSYDAAAQELTFAVNIEDTNEESVTSPDADERLTQSNLMLGFGNENDFVLGYKKIDLLTQAPTSTEGNVFTYVATDVELTADEALASTAVITTKMCVDRDSLQGVICGTGSDEAGNPATLVGDIVPFNLAGEEDVDARRVVVSNETCANCHDDKYLAKFGTGKMKHNGSYTNFEAECQMCHNATYSSSKSIVEHIDFKVRIHSLHANKRKGQEVGGEDRITFPEHYGNCATCHDKGQLSMDTAGVPATQTTDAELERVEFSPIAATCISCHGVKDSLVSHIRSEGGAANDPEGTYVPGSETCATCHAEGKAFGVDTVHPVNYK